jgi:hypothetical protein
MNMNLKGIMQTLGAKPGQVMSDPYARAWAPTPSPIKEAEGEDHEVSMAQNSLDTIIKMATELKAKMGENEKDIPAWIQDHITNSENFISQASSNYHEYSTNEAGINGAPRFPSLDGVANESINEEEIKWNAVENAIINFLKMNTKILDKRVKDRDTEGVKGGLKSIISGLTNAQRSLKLESTEIPAIALPSTVKSKLMIAIDTIKDAQLNYNQKVQVVKQVTDSLGIDKAEFNKIASRLKGTMESVNEVSYNVKADNAYQFINGATAVLGMYLKDEKLESGVKSTLQRVVKDLEGLRKYFFSRKDESVNEASRRATDFYGDSKYGKSIDLLLKGKWDSKKVENFLEKLGGGNDVKYARIIDFISGDAGLNIRKYKNIGEQLPDLMKQLEVLYKDFLSESVNKSLRLTKLK